MAVLAVRSRRLLAGAAAATAAAAMVVVPSGAASAAGALTWSQPSVSGPTARYGSAVTYDAKAQNVVLYGGSTGITTSTSGGGSVSLDAAGDTWTWNGSAWTQVAASSSPPSRLGPAFAYDPATSQSVLFGGANISIDTGDDSSSGFAVDADTWAWNGTAWSQLHPATSPSGRIGAAAAYDAASHSLVMFGGDGADGSGMPETWIFNGTTWTQAHPTTTPDAVDSVMMAADPATGHVILFGGDDADGNLLNETYSWNGSNWVQITAATSPPARDSAVMDYDAALGKIVLIGGEDDNGDPLADTWAFDGATWSQLSPANAPASLDAPGGAYDVASGQFVLFGGGDPDTGGGLATTYLLGAVTKPVARISGATRIDTATATSQAGFGAAGAKAVVLARDDAFPDALAGGPLAAYVGGPLLLTDPHTLSAATKTEIQRVLPAGGTVYVLGGTAAVSPSIDSALTAAGYKVTRIAGADRFDTAVKIAQTMGSPTTVFEATGQNFPDALSGVPAAIATKGAILLTNGTSQAAETKAYLAGLASSTRYTLGGPAATADPTATPLVGSDRYDTSAKVAAKFFPSPSTVGVATGTNYPDALAAGVLLGARSAPLVLVPSSGALPATVADYLAGIAAGVSGATAFGGTAAVGAGVATEVGQAIG